MGLTSGFPERQRYEFVARLIVSLAVLLPLLWVICRGTYTDSTVKWASGVVCIVVGHWLRR